MRVPHKRIRRAILHITSALFALAIGMAGPTKAQILAIALVGKLHSLGYARDVESRADLAGSDICAQSSNPWGLVWLFQDFQSANPNQIPQLLSDHPDDLNRIDALERHFRQNPRSEERRV